MIIDKTLSEILNLATERLLLMGLRPIQIRRQFLVITPTRISFCIKRLGIPNFQRGRTANAMQEKTIRKLKSEGYSYAQIAKRYKVSYQAFQRYFRKDRAIGTACAKCGTTRALLQRHHVNYETGECVLLCPACHSQETFRLLQIQVKS